MILDAHVDDAAWHFARDLGDISLDKSVLGGDVSATLQPERQRRGDNERRHADQRQLLAPLGHGAILTWFRPLTPVERLRPAFATPFRVPSSACADTSVVLILCSKLISCLLSREERPASAASTVASATRQMRLCTRSASAVRYTRLMRRSSLGVRRSTQPAATSRSIMRPAVAFSTSSISASSECEAPGRRCRRVSTSHCARVMPSRRTRRSNSVRNSRATSEITTPIYSSVFGIRPYSRVMISKLGYIIGKLGYNLIDAAGATS